MDYQQAIPRSDCNQIPNHLKAKAMKSIVVVGLWWSIKSTNWVEIGQANARMQPILDFPILFRKHQQTLEKDQIYLCNICSHELWKILCPTFSLWGWFNFWSHKKVRPRVWVLIVTKVFCSFEHDYALRIVDQSRCIPAKKFKPGLIQRRNLI